MKSGLLAFVSATLLLTAACGGGSGAGAKSGTDAGTGGGARTDVGSSPSSCLNLGCLRNVGDLMINCAGSGTCVEQLNGDALPLTSTVCFGNGVKVLATEQIASTTTGSTTSTLYQVKKGETLCYTRTLVTSSGFANGSPTAEIDSTVQDGAGVTVATISLDTNNVATVTCPDGPPTLVGADCGVSGSVLTGPFVYQGSLSTCSQGDCTY